MSSEILKSSTVVIAKDQISCDMAGESVILDLKSGIYYGLNAIGARVWSLMQESTPVEAILEVLLTEYEVEAERCETDLFALLQELASRNLIQIDRDNGKPAE